LDAAAASPIPCFEFDAWADHDPEKRDQMNAHLKPRLQSLFARAKSLKERKQRLDQEIDNEQQRPLPCNLKLGRLKRARLRLKDNLASINGVMATLGRSHMKPRIY